MPGSKTGIFEGVGIFALFVEEVVQPRYSELLANMMEEKYAGLGCGQRFSGSLFENTIHALAVTASLFVWRL